MKGFLSRLVALLPWDKFALIVLKYLAKRSENKLDDELVKAVEKALKG